MGLIIKDKFKQFMPGFPTVSDKYDVEGGIITGSSNIEFGQLVKYTSTVGYYEGAAGASAVGKIAGVALATNVKLNTTWPSDGANYKPGEAFNLLKHGFVAIELDSAATEAYVTPNADVYIILSSGKLTTSDKSSEGTIVQLPGYTFTGMYEKVGSVIVAEIYVK